MSKPLVRHSALLLALVLSLVGCRERSAPTPRTGVAWLDAPGEPVTVRPVLDRENAASRTVGSAGGTIVAGTEDVAFTLTVPKGALPGPVRITMVPVARLDGLPLSGGALATVQLEPEGLRFGKPATLTIRTRRRVRPAERVAFSYVADGRDTHLYPASGDSHSTTLSLLHFSGYGFGQAPPSDPGRIHLLYASAHESRLEARIAAAIAEARAKPDDAAAQARLTNTFHESFAEYYDAIVRPTMKIAESDDRMAQCALQMYLTWLRQLQLLGMDDGGAGLAAGASRSGPFAGRVEEAAASSQRIWAHAESRMMERARDGCRRHDLKAYDRVFAIMHEHALLGMEDSRGVQPESAIETMMDQCYRWEVELVSDVRSDLPGFHNRFQVGATAPYDATPDEHKATLGYRALEISGRPMEAIGRVLGAAAGSAPTPSAKSGSSGDASDMLAAFVEYGMNYALSPRGSRPGSLQVLGVGWTDVVRDTVGTSCAGRDEKQQATVADSVQVTLRIVPPTEIVKYTPVRASPLAHVHDEDMHEWMRFFTQFREAADEGSVSEPGEEEGDRDSGAAPITLTVRMKQQEPGVWRAELRTPKGVTGEGLSESGHLVLRHVPR